MKRLVYLFLLILLGVTTCQSVKASDLLTSDNSSSINDIATPASIDAGVVSDSGISSDIETDSDYFGYENYILKFTDENKDKALITSILYSENGALYVPGFINEVKVLGFDAIALSKNEEYLNITSIEFDSYFTDLYDYSFVGLSKLSKVTFNGKSITIGKGAFAGCNRLTDVTFSDKVKSIGNDAFLACTSLKKIKLRYGLTKIGDYAFSESGLTEISLPSSVSSIGKYAFANCKNLTKAYTGAKVTTIKSGLFNGCKSLSKVTFGKNVNKISSDTLRGCTGLKKIYFLGETFSSLKKLEIPKSAVIYVDSDYYSQFVKTLKKNTYFSKNKNKIKEN